MLALLKRSGRFAEFAGLISRQEQQLITIKLWEYSMNPQKIFLASSSELLKDRQQFELFISRRNKSWGKKGISLELVNWEDFIDAVSKTRLQDEYNKAIRDCVLFVMLIDTKVGKYSEEEFDTAYESFKQTGKPLIYTRCSSF